VAGGGRHRDKAAVDPLGGHLGDIDRFAAAQRDQIVGVNFASGLNDIRNGVEAGGVDGDRGWIVELGAEPVARKLVWRWAGDDQRVAVEVEVGDGVAKFGDNAVADDHVSRKLDPRRFIEHTQRIGGRP
jgi:hypothetical protein